MDWVSVKLVETESELEAAMTLRFRVFVSEQSVPPEEEVDQADAEASHIIALYQGQVRGTGRLVRRAAEIVQIGRMAVDRDCRRQGIGSRILEYLEEVARSQGMRHCVLHAQEHVKGFYAAHGYQEYGDVFLEANISHIEMWKEL